MAPKSTVVPRELFVPLTRQDLQEGTSLAEILKKGREGQPKSDAADGRSKSPVVAVLVALSGKELATIQRIAEAKGKTTRKELLYAIAADDFIHTERRAGGTFLLRNSNGKEEVVFPKPVLWE